MTAEEFPPIEIINIPGYAALTRPPAPNGATNTEPLLALVEEPPIGTPPGGDDPLPADIEDDGPNTWEEIDLGPALRGEISRPQATVLQRDDGQALFYPGRVNGIHGDSGLGKSMLVAYACAQELHDGHHVGWIDFEEPDETVIVERLRMFGCEDETITSQLHYFRPQDPFDIISIPRTVTASIEQQWTLLVIDSLGEAFGLAGINEDKDVEVGPWLRSVTRVLADAGPAVVTIDHATKAADNPLHPSGSKRKRAAITGASYLIEAPVALTRDHGGKLKITCAKDRHGNYQRGKEVCSLILAIGPQGIVTTCPAPGSGEPWDGPTHCIEAVTRLLTETSPEWLSTNKITKALRERGEQFRNQTIADAARIAAGNGQIEQRTGSRAALEYRASNPDETTTEPMDYSEAF